MAFSLAYGKMRVKANRNLDNTLHKEKGGMARIIKSLEGRKPITRKVNDSDRRQNKIQLTSKGKKQQVVEPLMNTLRQTALENIESKDLQSADNVLKTIIHHLNNILYS
jgi:DNA-binding MarR family transcriptional regulator